MKKIIYSLVAMLFMGGIITSCIPNTEPDGVKEMRLAHADYLRALADLTTANKDVVAAEAAVKNAQAAIKRAKAAQEEARARALELANELTAAQNEQDIANILDKMEQDRLNNEADLCAAKAKLAAAQKDLEDALAAIEIEKLAMSEEEAKALAAIKKEYVDAAAKLKAWYEDYKAEYQEWYDIYYIWLLRQALGAGDYVDPYWADYEGQSVWDYLYTWYDGVNLWTADMQEEFIAERIKLDEFDLENAKAEAEFWKGLLEDMDFDYLAEAQKYEDEANAMAPEFADLLRDSVLFENEYGTARDRAINAANDAYDEAKDAPLEAYKKAVDDLKKANKNWKKMVDELAIEDVDNAQKKWTAKKVGYAFEKKYALPEHVAGDVVDLYETQAGLNGFAQNVEFIKTAGKPDSLKVTIEAQKDSAAYATIVDTVWNGNQATEKLLKMKTGLKSVYDDFGRAYLYDLDAEGIKADKDVLEAYAKKVQSQYDSLLKILKSAKDENGKALVEAWAKKVEKAGKDVADLAKKVDAYDNRDGIADNNVYRYEDKVIPSDGQGPRLIIGYAYDGRTISQATDDATHFILDAPATPWFDATIAQPLTIAPTKADSTLVFNAIKDYFTAIASVNAKAVPYLKFIAGEGVGTFKLDSVRADKIEFAGIQMKKTNTYLDGLGLHRAAAYDNKGINALDAAPAVTNYVDAFTNLMQLFNHYVHGDPLTLPFYNATDAAYSATTSGVEDYVQYVKDFKADNAKSELGSFMKAFDSYSAADFTKYTNMSDEGKAVAKWMDACQRYFGVEGFAGIGEKVFFVKETFVEPENIAVFAGIPTYGAENLKKIANNKIPYTNALGRVDVVTPWTYQFEFAADAIENNIAVFDGAAAAADYVVNNNDMVMKSIVFELLEADYLVALANGEKSVSEIWAELGKVLEQVKADMDAVVASTKATQKANDDLAAKFNEALNTYRTATKDLKDERDAAIKEANDTYDAAKKEILDPISEKYVELRNKYNDLMNLADGLRGAYATLWANGAPDTDALLEYLYKKYTDALEDIDDLTYEINELKLLAGLITIEDPTLDEIQETIDLIQDILDEMDWDEYYDLEFWYEYWKAAYEAAVARFAE
ncbi:MAG: hypothetical protein J5639_06545 [Bacteroidales bacterium]|nr:hypothetical protein [Bacteroidales bacterium]